MQAPFYQLPASFRDDAGFVFLKDNQLYRQVNKVYQKQFENFTNNGLYKSLIEKEFLISHKESKENITGSDEHFITIIPEEIPFISYPYEWPFQMLKDAALITLEVAKEAMQYKAMLKDASAYNIQWHNNNLKLIDTLSFDFYDEQKPWIAYRQFCEHFLNPLTLMHYSQLPLQSILSSYIDGIPMQIASKLLPLQSKLKLSTYLHIHLHSKYSANQRKSNSTPKFSAAKFKNILLSLEQMIRSFSLSHKAVWSDYYNEAKQRENYITQKKSIIEQWITNMDDVKSAVDVGANEGEFSEILAAKGIFVIATDADHFSINNLYRKGKSIANSRILPLLIDFTKPSPAIGVNNTERTSFLDRCNHDLVMALAFIHHLTIGHNIPFKEIAKLFYQLGRKLIVEFIPFNDEKVVYMLSNKKNIYQWYTEENFKKDFSSLYKIISKEKVGDTGRTLYLMEAHEE